MRAAAPSPSATTKDVPVLLTAWLARLSEEFAPLLAAGRPTLRPAVIPTWDGAPGDVRHPAGRRSRRRSGSVRPQPRLAHKQRLA